MSVWLRRRCSCNGTATGPPMPMPTPTPNTRLSNVKARVYGCGRLRTERVSHSTLAHGGSRSPATGGTRGASRVSGIRRGRKWALGREDAAPFHWQVGGLACLARARHARSKGDWLFPFSAKTTAETCRVHVQRHEIPRIAVAGRELINGTTRSSFPSTRYVPSLTYHSPQTAEPGTRAFRETLPWVSSHVIGACQGYVCMRLF